MNPEARIRTLESQLGALIETNAALAGILAASYEEGSASLDHSLDPDVGEALVTVSAENERLRKQRDEYHALLEEYGRRELGSRRPPQGGLSDG